MAYNQKTRWIPSGYTTIKHPSLPGTEVHVSPDKKSALAYKGKAINPAWHYSFKTPQATARKISDFFSYQEETHKDKIQRQQTKDEFRHTLKVGDILSYSWGYDQTNVDFYQVVKATDKTVTIRMIAGKVKETGFMSGGATPAKGKFIGPPIVKRVTKGSQFEQNYISMKYGSLQLYDGRPKYTSWYG